MGKQAQETITKSGNLNPVWQRFIRFCQEEVKNGTLYEVELQDGLPLMVKEVIGKKKFSQRDN